MSQRHTIEMFYDGHCPLCLRETRMLQRLDRHHRIQFTNIAASDFDAANIAKTHDELMNEMHVRMSDGSWVTGVEAFRQLYTAVGFGPAVFVTRLPVIKQVLHAGYRVFARNRLRLTGRCTENCAVRPSQAHT